MSDVFMSEQLYGQLVSLCVNALPHKAFGMIGGRDIYHPSTLYPCSTNLRSTQEWNPIFESFGGFYSNPDFGFVISPAEVQSVIKMMDARGEVLSGVFHSHRVLPAEPSDIDIYLSSDIHYLCYIVSVVNPSAPKLGVFRINGNGYRDTRIIRC